jgi:hypothetical protein
MIARVAISEAVTMIKKEMMADSCNPILAEALFTTLLTVIIMTIDSPIVMIVLVIWR